MISIQGNSITNKLVIENIENLLICSLACNITDFAELNNWVIRSAMDVTLKAAKNELSNERNNLKALIFYFFCIATQLISAGGLKVKNQKEIT